MRWRLAVAVLCGLGVLSCNRVTSADARQLVENYARAVSEAYRQCDIGLIDSVVGPNAKEGKQLTGLIGVRLDMGITLDAQLLSLEVTGVEQTKDELRVRTKERWRYRDLKIGTGTQVGDESLDSYELLYAFRKIDKQWMVEETRFTAPPQVGRQIIPWQADREFLHGMSEPQTEPNGEKQ
jgi:hypothetical protein